MTGLRFILLFALLGASLPAFSQKTIHVFVALCDNEHQGIVKVPAAIGNGQDPATNLYWGCGYGVSAYFGRSADWEQAYKGKVSDIILERRVFRHKAGDYVLVADAYDGRHIKECTVDFLRACAGHGKMWIIFGQDTVGINGAAEVLAYIGHNGLMDFRLTEVFASADEAERKAIVLACASRSYFSSHIRRSGANPLLWTTNLMAPEAYTLHDALAAYISGGTDSEVRESAAKAYAKFQKCSLTAARNLLVTGYQVNIP